MFDKFALFPFDLVFDIDSTINDNTSIRTFISIYTQIR